MAAVVDQADVVVVGAGPVGLLTAIELAIGGARVLILERLAEPSQVLKAGGIGPLGVEALRRRGMSGAIDAAQRKALASMDRVGEQRIRDNGPRYAGHFGGLILVRADAQKEPDRLGARIDQQAIETMLLDRAGDLGVEIRRSCEVTRCEQDPDGVEVDWVSRHGSGGRIRSSYLVGCDGGRSAIRKMSGFSFPGTDPTLTMYQAVARIDHPERLASPGFQHTAGGMYLSFAGRLALIDFSGPPENRDAVVTREEFESVLRRVSQTDVRVTSLERPSRWTDNTRLVDSYRRGRIFLAGDAAHIHSPFGGQGLSLGLVDAANLGWKLAAVICGHRPASFLDTYTAERRPVAESVLANTLAQTAIMRPDSQSTAMREVLAQLMRFDDVNRAIGEMTTSLGLRYDLGRTSDEVGRLVGDMPVGDASRTLYDLMQDGAGVFLEAPEDGVAPKISGKTSLRLKRAAIKNGPSMLVRPDACIAWIGEGADTIGLQEAVDRWFS